MSKIAVLAASLTDITEWRNTSLIPGGIAPWIADEGMARSHAPFTSILCLSDWELWPGNLALRTFIEANHMVRRPAGDAVVGEAAQPALDASTPETSGQRRLRVLGCSQEFIRHASAGRRGQLVALHERDPHEFNRQVEMLAQDYGVPAWATPVEQAVRERAFPSAPEVSAQEQALRDAGVNPALLGMLESDILIALSGLARNNSPRFRTTVATLARRRNIPAWARDVTPASESEDRATLTRVVVEFMGSSYGEDCDAAPLSTLEQVANLARRGLDARRMGEMTVAYHCLHRASELIRTNVQTLDETAGFLPEPVPDEEPRPVARTRPPRPARAPTRPDPLQDNLREYMRQARAEDADRASRRDLERRRREESLRREDPPSGIDADE